MFPKHFFAICILATIFVATVSAQPTLSDGSIDLDKFIESYFPEMSVEDRQKIVESIKNVNYDADVTNDEITDVQNRNPILDIVIRYLKKALIWAAKNCVMEAAAYCKDHWTNPGELVNCAKEFMRVNKGKCAVG